LEASAGQPEDWGMFISHCYGNKNFLSFLPALYIEESRVDRRNPKEK
jgi:hypothetical protein